MTAAVHPDRNFKYWLLAPAIFLLLLIGLFPLIYSLVVSFMRIDMMDTDTSFRMVLTTTKTCSRTRGCGGRWGIRC